MRYIVTKESDDGTFLVGDIIRYEEDGAIVCINGGGWIDKNDVRIATMGMECIFDKKYVLKEIDKLEIRLAQLKRYI